MSCFVAISAVKYSSSKLKISNISEVLLLKIKEAIQYRLRRLPYTVLLRYKSCRQNISLVHCERCKCLNVLKDDS